MDPRAYYRRNTYRPASSVVLRDSPGLRSTHSVVGYTTSRQSNHQTLPGRRNVVSVHRSIRRGNHTGRYDRCPGSRYRRFGHPKHAIDLRILPIWASDIRPMPFADTLTLVQSMGCCQVVERKNNRNLPLDKRIQTCIMSIGRLRTALIGDKQMIRTQTKRQKPTYCSGCGKHLKHSDARLSKRPRGLWCCNTCQQKERRAMAAEAALLATMAAAA